MEHWLQQHGGQRVTPPPMGNPARGYPAVEDAPGHFVLVSWFP
ncbi:hypothetical protein [Polaromonas sp. CG_9.11]|nr:hypothetical protein [Polaromonas sp. CG_9.11]MBG6074624.1 poly(3-hydroxyalkanoate) synthetase [Polaromonas sp. CG_9.11]